MTIWSRLTANWPLKLTSLLLAILLWSVAAFEEPSTRLVRVQLQLEPPAGRIVVQAPTTAQALVVGPARELLKLGDGSLTLVKPVIDTATGRQIPLLLGPADVVLPRDVKAEIRDIEPREILIGLGAALMRILAIETSCDETSAAVVSAGAGDRPRLESLIILSQDVHRIFGGVVPELASRAHLIALPAVVDRALGEANTSREAIDAIAVTQGPGLVGALLVGAMYGKTLAWALGKPFLGVHHLEGHLFAATLEDPEFRPPFVGLLVSGGHTMLLDVPAWGTYRLLGQTRDDAAGEAFDKVGTLLGLGYPGGPRIEKLAREGKPRFKLPRPMLAELGQRGPDQYAFSFSGLKTAVLRAVQQSTDLERDRADLARSFQDAAIDVLVEKTAHATAALGYPTAMLGGGVACNQALIAELRRRLGTTARVVAATPRLNTDNAAMIGAAAAWHLARGERSGWELEARSDLAFPGLVAAL